MSGDAKPWLDAIQDAMGYFDAYQRKGDSIDKLYANLEKMAEGSVDREFKAFWANIEVMKPSIYARPPVPVCTPRHKDRKELPRVAAELLERVMMTSFDVSGMSDSMLMLRDDVCISGRGAMWLRLEEDEKGKRICYDHLDRHDFLHEPARKWREVGWVARREWLTAPQGVKRFGQEWLHAGFIEGTLDNDRRDDKSAYKGERKAEVWEVWDKASKKVYWVNKSIPKLLDEQDPILNLEGYFPCPQPAYATVQRGSLIPVPDFVYYKDQIEEINELTARIGGLSHALRMKGFYAAGTDGIGDVIERALKDMDNRALMIPVPNFASLGGSQLKDAIVWMPVREVAETVKILIELRRQHIDDIYQITGLSDIMRGSTDPNETLGAQELKSQYGNIRIRDKQAGLIRVARDAARLAGEIIAENFDQKTITDMGQMDLPSDEEIQGQIQQITQQVQQALSDPNILAQAQANPEQAQQAKQQAMDQIAKLEQTTTIEKIIGLYQEQRMRPFVLDIETDSTIQPDENTQKKLAGEFLTSIGGFISSAGPIVQAQPQMGGFVAEALKFAARPFRPGRAMDQAIDDLALQLQQMAKAPKSPSPEEIKAQIDQKALEAKMQVEQQKGQLEQQKMQAEIAMAREEHSMKMLEMQASADLGQAKLAQEKEMHGQQMEHGKMQMDHDMSKHQDTMAQSIMKQDYRKQERDDATKVASAKAGLPVGYTAEQDRAKFDGILKELEQNREVLMEILANVVKENDTRHQEVVGRLQAGDQTREHIMSGIEKGQKPRDIVAQLRKRKAS
jgi:hypothetical protein